jgi:molybdenum transport protein
LQKYNVTVQHSLASGTLVAPGTTFLEAVGLAQNLHLVWKVCQNIFEYTSGIATRTRTLVDLAKDVNPAISVVTTRKVFPGTKALAVKAVLAGGAMPHRLGLSETVLVFPNHLAFLGGLEGFLQLITEIKQKCQEKKICVEVERLEDARQALKAGVEIIQFDKLDKIELEKAVEELKSLDERVQIAAAGGINQANVQAFAATGVDILVTTAPYFGLPADIAVKIQASPKT